MTDTTLDDWFPRTAAGPEAAEQARRLGIVSGGALSKGLSIKLDRGALVEGMAVGRYVVVHGQTGRRFFSIITDVALDSTNPAIEKTPPDTSDPFLAQVYQGSSAFGRLEVSPMLVLDEGADEPKPVKTVPAHFSPVYEATEDDVNRVFGAADERLVQVEGAVRAEVRLQAAVDPLRRVPVQFLLDALGHDRQVFLAG